MSELASSAHLALACVWLGCLVTDVIVERTLSSTEHAFEVRLSRLHWRVALLVEVPAFLGVFVTGAYRLSAPHAASPGFHVMLTTGVLTIFLNVFRVWLIRKRLSAALRDSWTAHGKLVFLQHKLDALVLLGVLTSVVAGVVGTSAA